MADIQTLVDAIPDANDGNIISSDYHNTIKAALEAIAAQLSGGAGPAVTVTVQPNFVAIAGGAKPWVVGLGVASDAGGSTDGFLALNLPDSAVIQSMTVIGARPSTSNFGTVNLLVLPIAGGGTTGITTLIQVDLSAAGNPFTLTGTPTPTISGLTAGALAAMQVVQNSQFKYVIDAKVVSTVQTQGSVLIYALQVNYTTSS